MQDAWIAGYLLDWDRLVHPDIPTQPIGNVSIYIYIFPRPWKHKYRHMFPIPWKHMYIHMMFPKSSNMWMYTGEEVDLMGLGLASAPLRKKLLLFKVVEPS